MLSMTMINISCVVNPTLLGSSVSLVTIKVAVFLTRVQNRYRDDLTVPSSTTVGRVHFSRLRVDIFRGKIDCSDTFKSSVDSFVLELGFEWVHSGWTCVS